MLVEKTELEHTVEALRDGGLLRVLGDLLPTARRPTPTQIFLDDLQERVSPALERMAGARAAPALVSGLRALAAEVPASVAGLDPFRLHDLLDVVEREVAALQAAGPDRLLSNDATIQITAPALSGHDLVRAAGLPAGTARPTSREPNMG